MTVDCYSLIVLLENDELKIGLLCTKFNLKKNLSDWRECSCRYGGKILIYQETHHSQKKR